jgi:hypothetical protein
MTTWQIKEKKVDVKLTYSKQFGITAMNLKDGKSGKVTGGAFKKAIKYISEL